MGIVMLLRSKSGVKLFDSINIALLLLISLVSVLPFLYIMAGSIAAPEEFLKKSFMVFPTSFSLDTYRYIFSTGTIVDSLLVSVFVTVAGTLVNLICTIIMAYPLARKTLPGRKAIMFLVVFTMLFSGGIIPTFLVVKSLGMLNSYWALIVPGAISAFYLIILKNFFQQIPEGVEESAKIDGCNDIQILVSMILPLSLPSIATFTLFYAVGHWNSYFSAVLYINDAAKWPVQVLLRQIVILANGGFGDSSSLGESVVVPSQSLNMGVIVVSTLPILIVYPFLQKHFAKGLLVGSMKG
jgi:putative aldouronate transport system permease protein